MGAGAYSSIETFTSDDYGNLLTRVADGVTTTYTWDDVNRLKAISTSDDSKKQSHTFGISGFRRKKKDINNVETTEYAAGLSTEVSKVTSGETITYLKGGGGIMGFERSSDGAMFYFLTDALSTVRDVVRGTDGAVLQSYEYTENGEKTVTLDGGIQNWKTWVGGHSVQDETADTDLYLMGHRWYSASAGGRFLSRDPIGFAGGMNLYSYGNSPVTTVDPEGLTPYDSPSAAARAALLEMNGLILEGQLGEALVIARGVAQQFGAQVLAGGIGANLIALNNMIQRTLQQMQGRAGQFVGNCQEIARGFFDIFKSLGMNPQVVQLKSQADYIMTSNPNFGGAVSQNGLHWGIQIQGRVYDAFTGLQGVPVDQYASMFMTRAGTPIMTVVESGVIGR